MFRKCLVGCAAALALTAGSFALASPPAEAIPIRKVTMQSRQAHWYRPWLKHTGTVKAIHGGVVDPKASDYRTGTVVTHLNTATMRANLPTTLPSRVYTPVQKLKVAPVALPGR